LIRRLKDEDVDVASAAAVTLGRIGNATATGALRQSLAGAGDKIRSAVAEGCILCAERLMAQNKHSDAAEIYDQVRAAGYGAELIPAMAGEKRIYIVRIRSLPSKAEAQALADQLKGKYGVENPKVVS